MTIVPDKWKKSGSPPRHSASEDPSPAPFSDNASEQITARTLRNFSHELDEEITEALTTLPIGVTSVNEDTGPIVVLEAEDIPFTPTPPITADNVQDAIVEAVTLINNAEINNLGNVWRFDPNVGGIPGPGQFTSDTGSVIASWIKLSYLDDTKTDMSALLLNLRIGSIIVAQTESNSGNWVRYRVAGDAIDFDSYVHLFVTVNDAAGGADGWLDTVFVFSLGDLGGGGGGGTPVDEVAYRHVQGVPASVWTIPHPLAFIPNVSVVDSAGSLIEGDVVYESTSVITVYFSGSFSGQAFLS